MIRDISLYVNLSTFRTTTERPSHTYARVQLNMYVVTAQICYRSKHVRSQREPTLKKWPGCIAGGGSVTGVCAWNWASNCSTACSPQHTRTETTTTTKKKS